MGMDASAKEDGGESGPPRQDGKIENRISIRWHDTQSFAVDPLQGYIREQGLRMGFSHGHYQELSFSGAGGGGGCHQVKVPASTVPHPIVLDDADDKSKVGRQPSAECICGVGPRLPRVYIPRAAWQPGLKEASLARMFLHRNASTPESFPCTKLALPDQIQRM